MDKELTHLDENGAAKMVDVSDKGDTDRLARAKGKVKMHPETIKLVVKGLMKKGDVLNTARIAGIMACKKTGDLIPLCHPLLINDCEINFTVREAEGYIEIESVVKTYGKTGVEMEALTAVSVAALTVYDMCKAADKSMEITDIFLSEKRGGKSGVYLAQNR